MNMFSQLVESFKAGYNYAYKLKTGYQMKLIGSIGNIPIFYDPDVVIARGLYFSLTERLNDGTTRIIVDDHFLNLLEETKQVLILHEFGHVYLRHLERATLDEYGRSTALNIEYEADEFAATYFDKNACMRALKEAKEKGPVISDAPNQIEERYNNLFCKNIVHVDRKIMIDAGFSSDARMSAWLVSAPYGQINLMAGRA